METKGILGILGQHFQKSDLPSSPDLPGLLLMRCAAGSQAYGMATAESDVDIRGVFVPTMDYMLGFLKRVEQIERKPETVIYALQKYMKLACDANPNILELLFMPEVCVLEQHPLFRLLKDNRKMFLSKKVRWTYTGYASSQMKRIARHRQYLLHPLEKQPQRSDYGLPEGESLIPREQMGAFWVTVAHILRDIAAEVPHLNDLYANAVEIMQSEGFPGWEGLVQKCDGVPQDALKYVQKLTGASDNFIETLQHEQKYYHAVDEWGKYQEWKKSRNPMRAELEAKYGFDCKHASHAVRLSRQGEEIMRTGELQVRLPDAQKIRAIRDGVWLDGTPITYEKVLEFVKQKELDMQQLYESADCKLPRYPNAKALDQLCVEITSKANPGV